jgi:hypothetical protein
MLKIRRYKQGARVTETGQFLPVFVHSAIGYKLLAERRVNHRGPEKQNYI